MSGMQIGGTLAGTSYAANAQVFAPLTDESITGGKMYAIGKPNYCDRGTTIERIAGGASNKIFFMHVYALCGPDPTTGGNAWGFGGGRDAAPGISGHLPWLRASNLGQTYITTGAAFQNAPTPYYEKCKPTDPATPHVASMLVLLGDASVRVAEL